MGKDEGYLEELVKGSFRKKVMALFQFYDIDKTGNISYGELLKMVQRDYYPSSTVTPNSSWSP